MRDACIEFYRKRLKMCAFGNICFGPLTNEHFRLPKDIFTTCLKYVLSVKILAVRILIEGVVTKDC